MTPRLVDIWRHPIKAHGREALAQVTLSEGSALPWDRAWAVTHEKSKADGTGWAQCANFSRAASAPNLQAVDCRFDETTGLITLMHQDKADLTFDPDGDTQAFLKWIKPLMPEERAASTGLFRVDGVSLTDSTFPSISLNNLASHRAVADALGQHLSPLRWRGNLWLDDLSPWEEKNWVGKDIRIGEAILEIREEITRCKTTMANIKTGERDADTLGALRSQWGHQEFGVYGVVKQGGQIKRGDTVEIIT
ncbi:MAG: MOSC domain-containing protein [Pseudoruegeria sp.]